MSVNKFAPKSFDDQTVLTIETSNSLSYAPSSLSYAPSSELTSYLDSSDPSVASRSDITRSSSASRPLISLLNDSVVYRPTKTTYHPIHRPIKTGDYTSSLFDFYSLKRRSATPDIRRSVTPKSVRPRSITPHICDRQPHVCDRLYSDGLHTQNMKAKQEILRRKMLEEEEENRMKSVPLLRNMSYTPLKKRPYDEDNEEKMYNSVHEYLVQDGKERLAKKEEFEKEQELREQELTEHRKGQKLLSPREKDRVCGRLYDRSFDKQHDGRERRKKIELKNAPKPVAAQRSISIGRATALYERLMAKKRYSEKKIEEARSVRPEPFKARRIGQIDINK